MDFFFPKFKRDPNEKIESLYYGVAHGHQVVTTIVKPSVDRNRMETTRMAAEPGMARGEGGRIATLILGGMETTLDEMEYILEEAKQKRFEFKRTRQDIVKMAHVLLERRNDAIKYYRKNPSEAPKPRPKQLFLPVGCRLVDTNEPGLRVLAEV